MLEEINTMIEKSFDLKATGKNADELTTLLVQALNRCDIQRENLKAEKQTPRVKARLTNYSTMRLALATALFQLQEANA